MTDRPAVKGRVLIIAGSDSSGGAGIQADIKTVTALGGYAATAITAITVQTTAEVRAVEMLRPRLVADQIAAVLEDIGADAIKIGMLGGASIARAVAEALASAADLPLVLDPVLAATSGDALIEEGGGSALMDVLGARATLLTPNIPEAEAISGRTIASEAEMDAAGRVLLAAGPEAVLMKGGHLAGEQVIDLLVTGQGTHRFADRRIDTTSTHGTGCTLASAIATRLAQGRPLVEAVGEARAYLRRALETAPGFGHGHGPVNHGVTFFH